MPDSRVKATNHALRSRRLVKATRNKVVRKQMKTPGEGQTAWGIKLFRDCHMAHSYPSGKRISPPINAKCMMDKAVQVSLDDDMADGATGIGMIHQTQAAQELNHSFQIQHWPGSQPTPNRRSLENEEDIEHVEEIPLSSEVHAETLNVNRYESRHETDKTDGTWLPEEDTKPDDSCGIQCLYFTMQCCECTIL